MTRGLSDIAALELGIVSNLFNAYIDQAIRFQYKRALARGIVRLLTPRR